MGQTLVKQNLISNVFKGIDEDSSGTISRHELIDWIRDERFLSNTRFTNESLRQNVLNMMKILDQDKDHTICQKELETYLSTLSVDAIRDLSKSLQGFTDTTRRQVVQRIWNALDVNKDGIVDRDEVMFWLSHEAAWQKYLGESKTRSALGQEAVFNKMDRNHDGLISLRELEQFFEDWKLRDLREFSEDQMYYEALSEYKRNPTSDAKKRLAQLQQDRAFLDKLEEHESKKKLKKKQKKQSHDDDEE